jgi:hypothetical protein
MSEMRKTCENTRAIAELITLGAARSLALRGYSCPEESTVASSSACSQRRPLITLHQPPSNPLTSRSSSPSSLALLHFISFASRLGSARRSSRRVVRRGASLHWGTFAPTYLLSALQTAAQLARFISSLMFSPRSVSATGREG